MSKKKEQKAYTIWVKMEATLGFTVRSDSPEDALASAREDIDDIQFVADGVEHMDSTVRIQGVLEND